MTAVPIRRDEPGFEMRVVTPALARRWLARNVRNRNIRQSVVDTYARDMLNGNWRMTGEAIKFDTNGALSDGQHRLNAIVQSGVSVEMLIVHGIEPDAQSVMDTGARRSASDALTLDGQKNASILAAVARLALREPGAGFVTPEEKVAYPTHTEIASFVFDHPEIHDAATAASRYYPAFDCPPSVQGVAWMRFFEIDPADTVLFFSGVAELRTDGPGDPRLALIRRLSNARRNRERLEQAAYLSLVFRAWNAWRGGQSVAKFQTDARGNAVKVPTRLA